MISISATQKAGSEKPTMLVAISVRDTGCSGFMPGEQPQRHADHDRHQQRGEGQLHGRRQALQDQAHRVLLVDEAAAQAAVQRAVHEGQVLAPQRLVEPEPRDGGQPFLLVHVLADQDVDRVADGMQADEDDQRHRHHHEQRLQQPAQQPAGHRMTSRSAASTYGGRVEGVHSSPSSSGSA